MGRLSGPVTADLRIPSLGHLRDIINLSRQATADLNCHARLLAVSQATRQFHLAAGLAAEKVHVVYNGVDLDEFRPRTAVGLSSSRARPAARYATGRHDRPNRPAQGTGRVVAGCRGDRRPVAQRPLSDRGPTALREGRIAAVRGATCTRHVGWTAAGGGFTFSGSAATSDTLLSELTLLVHPARQEPLGRVLLEAAAAGMAIVATDVGGTSEIFPPEQHAARLGAARRSAGPGPRRRRIARRPGLAALLGRCRPPPGGRAVRHPHVDRQAAPTLSRLRVDWRTASCRTQTGGRWANAHSCTKLAVGKSSNRLPLGPSLQRLGIRRSSL